MKPWPPNDPGSGMSIKRNHPPFCESTGPIVQEGFVAARIRALQALQAQAFIGNRSHSPMIPCSPGQDLSCEPPCASRSVLAVTLAADGLSKSDNGKFDQARAEEICQGHREKTQKTLVEGKSSIPISLSQALTNHNCNLKPRESRIPPIKGFHDTNVHIKAASSSEDVGPIKHYVPSTTSTKSLDSVAQRPPSQEATGSPGPEILGPRPISASLADSSALLNCFPYGDLGESNYSLADWHSRNSRVSRKSVADKLGFLVERGCVAGDTLGNVNDGSKIPAKPPTPVDLHQCQAKEPILFDDDGPQAFLPLHGTSSGHVSTAGGPPHGSYDHSSSQIKQPDPYPVQQIDSPQEIQPAETHDYRKPVFKRSSSDVSSHMVERPASSENKYRRAFPTSQLHPTKRSNGESIELHRLHLNNFPNGKNGRRCSASATASSYRSTRPQSVDDGTTSDHFQWQESSKPASLESRSRRSSFGKGQSHVSGSRSMSWFKKSWFYPFSEDSQDAVTESPMRSVVSPPTSRTTDAAQQDISPSPKQPSRDTSQARSFSGDSQHAVEELPRTSIVGTPTSRTTYGAQQDFPSGPKQPSRDKRRTYSIHDSEQESEGRVMTGPTDAKPIRQEQTTQKEDVCSASQDANPALAPGDQRPTPRGWTSRKSSPTSLVPAISSEGSENPSQNKSPGHAESFSGRSQKSTDSKPLTIPARGSSKRTATCPSKIASVLSTTSRENSLLRQEKSRETLHSSRTHSLKSSSSISVLLGGPSPHTPALSTVSARQTPKSRAVSPEQEPVERAQRRPRGRGRRIKKIQVIISFDGADDLVVEAVTSIQGGSGAGQGERQGPASYF